MEYFETNNRFPGDRVNLQRTTSNLVMFLFHNVWVSILYLSLLKHCVVLYGSSAVFTFVAFIGIASKIVRSLSNFQIFESYFFDFFWKCKINKLFRTSDYQITFLRKWSYIFPFFELGRYLNYEVRNGEGPWRV